MARYLIKRVLLAISTLAAASLITFWLFFAIPSDPAAMQCGKSCNEHVLAQIRATMELDRPTRELYVEYMKGIFVGRTIGRGAGAQRCDAPCFGISFRTNEQVRDILARTLPTTLSIVIGAAILWTVIGVGLGVISALARGTWVDKLAIGISLAGASSQIYFVGLMLQLVLVFQLHWLSPPRYVSPFDSVSGWLAGMILPWTTLAFVRSALYARLTRAQMVETMSEDFVRTARAKGLPPRTVQLRHALRAAITPVVTVAGVDLGVALGGAVITETVFGMTGIGFISVQAAQQLNLPIVMATVLLSSFFIVAANLLVDLMYSVIDPRVRLAG